MAKATKRGSSRNPKVVLEFSVLDDETKKRLASCISKSGKVRVTMTASGTSNVGTRGFTQKID